MSEDASNGNEFLAQLYEGLRRQHEFVYEQGFKVQALELTLRSFPDTRAKYESALAQVKSKEVLDSMRSSLAGHDAAIALLRSGRIGSA